MANENWEEISAWDVEEDMDMDLTQRITVHTVRHLNPDDAEDLEYQLVQAHKFPTYAAATKWGNQHKKKSININVDDNVAKKLPEEKEKENVPKGVLLGKPAKPTNDKNLSGDDHEVNQSTSSPSCIHPSPPPSDPDPVNSSRSLSRRHNDRVHKLSNQRLLNQLVSPVEMDTNLVKGDTNRDPEFTKYKMLKKSMKYKNGNTKNKDRKGGVDKLRVEVW
ncbi:4551_t:CDS:1 [Acaulospora morrowiae]|uniref:4551_t:CDS:1 n=1 Tax=Acaulospora morrowiae TaxID=94023 RepID=A0A9N9CEI8_9GLOM|nr:4551_t:CDS:1 [Acaulospora morrowiae]